MTLRLREVHGAPKETLLFHYVLPKKNFGLTSDVRIRRCSAYTDVVSDVFFTYTSNFDRPSSTHHHSFSSPLSSMQHSAGGWANFSPAARRLLRTARRRRMPSMVPPSSLPNQWSAHGRAQRARNRASNTNPARGAPLLECGQRGAAAAGAPRSPVSIRCSRRKGRIYGNVRRFPGRAAVTCTAGRE